MLVLTAVVSSNPTQSIFYYEVTTVLDELVLGYWWTQTYYGCLGEHKYYKMRLAVEKLLEDYYYLAHRTLCVRL